MQAAAHPADKPYLYFVRKKDCKSHFFTASESEFQAFLAGPNSFLNGPSECP
jgi:cell division protein YceG involved in septum cleavage